MSKKQQVVLALAMLGIVAMLVWIPYTATYKWESSPATTASAGYNWILREPGAKVCKFSVEEKLQVTFNYNGFDVTACNIAIDSRRLGITLGAATVGIAALLILIGLFNPKKIKEISQVRREHTLAELSSSSSRNTQNNELVANLLRIDPLLQISSGDMSENSPLIITAKEDYIPIEYAIVEIMHKRFGDLDSELELQELFETDDRHIDALTFRIGDKGSNSLSRKITYYFDITAGMSEIIRKHQKMWWQPWK